MGYTIDVDIGGTLTDGLFSDGQRAEMVKVDTTPHDFTVCFFECLNEGARHRFTRKRQHAQPRSIFLLIDDQRAATIEEKINFGEIRGQAHAVSTLRVPALIASARSCTSAG